MITNSPYAEYWKSIAPTNVKIDPEPLNGLTKPSTVDTLQLRGVDLQRFVKPLGRMTAVQMDVIAAAIALVVEYQ